MTHSSGWRALALGVALTGCAPDVGARTATDGSALAGSWSDLESRVLVPRCATAACHLGTPPAVYPTLDEGASFGALVGVPSDELPSMNLVEPGDPDRSYLVLKLRGTADAQGGSGVRMPAADAPLDDADLNAIEAWIANGAPND